MSLSMELSQRLRLSCLVRSLAGRRTRKRRPQLAQRSTRPRLEWLEDRLAPATLTINTLADNTTDTSVLTLRDAVVLVDNDGNPASLGQASMPSGWTSQIVGSFGTNDTIQFDPAILTSTQQTITLGENELLLIRNVTINGPGAGRLAISGNNTSRVFGVVPGINTGQVSDSISGLTIENGWVPAPFQAFAMGGGIANYGMLKLTDCTLSSNTAASPGEGGGIYNGNGGTLTVNNCVFSSNHSTFGGGIFNNLGTVTVTGSSFSGNLVQDGGGVFNEEGSLTVGACTFSSNRAAYEGGGIYNGHGMVTVNDNSLLSTNVASFGAGIFATGGTLTVSGSTLNGNVAQGGGALYLSQSATATIQGSTQLLGNSADQGGGAYNGGTLTFSDCFLSQNSATDGGGIYNSRGTLVVTNSALSGNTAAYLGGGIFSDYPATVTINSSSSITSNSAGYFGGGIRNQGALSVMDSTVCGNSAPSGADVSTVGTLNVTNSDVCVINQTITTTILSGPDSPLVLGQAATFSAIVYPFFLVYSPSPTGTVSFLLDGATPLGTAALDIHGYATITTTGLPLGTHTITASYSGDATFFASTSAGFSQSVLSAQQQVGVVATQVGTLVTAGTLSRGNGTALNTKLSGAIASLNAGATTAGINQLKAFINQVSAFQKNGKLGSADTQTLITAANLAMTAANGGTPVSNTGAFQLLNGASSSYAVSTCNWITSGIQSVWAEDDSGNGLNADQLNRLTDAMSYLNTTLGALGVSLSWASDPTSADVTVHFATSTPQGDAAAGVVGFTTPDNKVYFVSTWNYYNGSDPTQIADGQLDFATLAVHELAHTVGLGESADANSVMYEYLAPGTVRRTLTDGNLSLINTNADRFMKIDAGAFLEAPSFLEMIAAVSSFHTDAATVWAQGKEPVSQAMRPWTADSEAVGRRVPIRDGDYDAVTSKWQGRKDLNAYWEASAAERLTELEVLGYLFSRTHSA